jgi:hypothetical protein
MADDPNAAGYDQLGNWHPATSFDAPAPLNRQQALLNASRHGKQLTTEQMNMASGVPTSEPGVFAFLGGKAEAADLPQMTPARPQGGLPIHAAPPELPLQGYTQGLPLAGMMGGGVPLNIQPQFNLSSDDKITDVIKSANYLQQQKAALQANPYITEGDIEAGYMPPPTIRTPYDFVQNLTRHGVGLGDAIGAFQSEYDKGNPDVLALEGADNFAARIPGRAQNFQIAARNELDQVKYGIGQYLGLPGAAEKKAASDENVDAEIPGLGTFAGKTAMQATLAAPITGVLMPVAGKAVGMLPWFKPAAAAVEALGGAPLTEETVQSLGPVAKKLATTRDLFGNILGWGSLDVAAHRNPLGTAAGFIAFHGAGTALGWGGTKLANWWRGAAPDALEKAYEALSRGSGIPVEALKQRVTDTSKLFDMLRSINTPPHVMQQLYKAGTMGELGDEFAKGYGRYAADSRLTQDEFKSVIGAVPGKYQSMAQSAYDAAIAGQPLPGKDVSVDLHVVETPQDVAGAKYWYPDGSQYQQRLNWGLKSPLTKEAQDLVTDAEGGMPAFMTNNLKKIMKDNGFTDEAIAAMKPEEAIQALKLKGEIPGAKSTKVIVKNFSNPVIVQWNKDQTLAEALMQHLQTEPQVAAVTHNILNWYADMGYVGKKEYEEVSTEVASRLAKKAGYDTVIFRGPDASKDFVLDLKDKADIGTEYKDLNDRIQSKIDGFKERYFKGLEDVKFGRDIPPETAEKVAGEQEPGGGIFRALANQRGAIGPLEIATTTPRPERVFNELINAEGRSVRSDDPELKGWSGLHYKLMRQFGPEYKDAEFNDVDMAVIKRGWVRGGRSGLGPFVEFNWSNPTARRNALAFMERNFKQGDVAQVDMWRMDDKGIPRREGFAENNQTLLMKSLAEGSHIQTRSITAAFRAAPFALAGPAAAGLGALMASKETQAIEIPPEAAEPVFGAITTAEKGIYEKYIKGLFDKMMKEPEGSYSQGIYKEKLSDYFSAWRRDFPKEPLPVKWPAKFGKLVLKDPGTKLGWLALLAGIPLVSDDKAQAMEFPLGDGLRGVSDAIEHEIANSSTAKAAFEKMGLNMKAVAKDVLANPVDSTTSDYGMRLVIAPKETMGKDTQGWLGLLASTREKTGLVGRLPADLDDSSVHATWWGGLTSKWQGLIGGKNSAANETIEAWKQLIADNNVTEEQGNKFWYAYDNMRTLPDGSITYAGEVPREKLGENVLEAARQSVDQFNNKLLTLQSGIDPRVQGILDKYGLPHNADMMKRILFLQSDAYDPSATVGSDRYPWGQIPTVHEEAAAKEAQGMLNIQDWQKMDMDFVRMRMSAQPTVNASATLQDLMNKEMETHGSFQNMPSDIKLQYRAWQQLKQDLDDGVARRERGAIPMRDVLSSVHYFGPISDPNDAIMPEAVRDPDIGKSIERYVAGVYHKIFWDEQLHRTRLYQRLLVAQGKDSLANQVVNIVNGLRGMKGLRSDTQLMKFFNYAWSKVGGKGNFTVEDVRNIGSAINDLQFYTKIGLGLRWPAQNLTQPLVTNPLGPRWLMRGYASIMADWAGAKAEAEEVGLLTGKSVLQSEMPHFEKLSQVAGFLPGLTEDQNRILMMRIGKLHALDMIDRTGSYKVPGYLQGFDHSVFDTKDAMKIAKEAGRTYVNNTQFFFGNMGRPSMMVGGVGTRIATQFKGFTWSYGTLLKNTIMHAIREKDPFPMLNMIIPLAMIGGPQAVLNLAPGIGLYEFARRWALSQGHDLPSFGTQTITDWTLNMMGINPDNDVMKALNQFQITRSLDPMQLPQLAGEQGYKDVIDFLAGPTVGTAFDMVKDIADWTHGETSGTQLVRNTAGGLFPLATSMTEAAHEMWPQAFPSWYRGGTYSPSGRPLVEPRTWYQILMRALNLQPSPRSQRYDYMVKIENALEGRQANLVSGLLQQAKKEGFIITKQDMAAMRGKITQEEKTTSQPNLVIPRR